MKTRTPKFASTPTLTDKVKKAATKKVEATTTRNAFSKQEIKHANKLLNETS